MIDFPIAEVLGMSALSMVIMVGWFGYPLVTLVLCWIDKQAGKGEKIAWTAFIIITWLFFAIGALVYGLVKHKSFFKLIPILIVAASVYFGMNMMDYASNITNKVSVSAVSKNVQDPIKKQTILGHLDVLNQEGVSIENPVNHLLANYVMLLSMDGLTDREYKEWLMLFENRQNIDAEKFATKLQKKAL